MEERVGLRGRACGPLRVRVQRLERTVGQIRPVAPLDVPRVRVVQVARVAGDVQRLDAAVAAGHRIARWKVGPRPPVERIADRLAERVGASRGHINIVCALPELQSMRAVRAAWTGAVAGTLFALARGTSTMVLLFICTLFLSSSLLFLVQPMIA